MYNSQYYTCEQIDQRLLQGYLDDYNTQTGQSLTKAQFLTKLGNIFSKEGVIDNIATQVGYYECDTAAETAAKVITVANYALFAGGSMKVKFANNNTANNATLNINSQGAKALYYQGERASATNSWDANEVVEIYYDGTSYYANNVKGGSGSGVYDVSKEHPTSGPNGDGKFTLEYILNSSNVNELIPVNKREPGMTIKFVSTSDNKYVQYRLMAASFSTTESDWQGVDMKLIAGSKNLLASGVAAEVIMPIFGMDISPISEEGYIINNGVYEASALQTADIVYVTKGTKIYCGYSGFTLRYGCYLQKPVENNVAFSFGTLHNEPDYIDIESDCWLAVSHLSSGTVVYKTVGRDFDAVPTKGSRNFVDSDTVKRAVDNVALQSGEKVKNVSIENAVSAGSSKLPTSGAVAKDLFLVASEGFYLSDVTVEGNGNVLTPVHIKNGYYYNNVFYEHETNKTYIFDLSGIMASVITSLVTFGNVSDNKVLIFDKEYNLIGGMPYLPTYVGKILRKNNYLIGFTSGTAPVITGYSSYKENSYIDDKNIINGRLKLSGQCINGFDSIVLGVDNLFDSSAEGNLFGKYINPANGQIVDSPSYNTSDFIPVDVDQIYSFTFDKSSSARFVIGYDSNKGVISNAFNPRSYVSSVVIPSNVAYVRFSYANDNNVVIFNKGEQIPLQVYLTFMKTPLYSNLYNIEDVDVKHGKYVNPANGDLNDGTYDTSHLIEVEEGEVYSYNDSFNGTMRFLAGYNTNKEIISNAFSPNTYVKRIVIPSGVKYIRFSYKNNANLYPIFVLGESTSCIENSYKDKTIGSEVLNYNEIANKIYFKDYIQRISGELASGEQLKLDANNIKTNKRLVFMATISSFTSISIGHGLSGFGANYIIIDGTNIYAHKLVPTDTVYATIPHGLTISNNIGVIMEVGEDAVCHCSVISDGTRFDTEIADWLGCNGDIFVKADSASLTDCQLSWTCDGYKKDTQVYGDSYITHTDSYRWAYHFILDGYGKNVLINGYAGSGATEGFAALSMNIFHSRPKFILWALGMNNPDSTGSEPSAINADWMTAVNKFLSICNQFNITPIFAKIPNVLGTQTSGVYYHNKKNEWIEESGYRYVDIPNAVGAQNNGTWYSGMLSSDGVHPTQKGAIAIYNQMIASVPELLV